MPTCYFCANDYDEAVQSQVEGLDYWIDSFESSNQTLPPQCAACGCQIIGQGVQEGSTLFCCAHCAKGAGANEVRDRA